MFISRKEFDREIQFVNGSYVDLRDKYYALQERHNALLLHLRLREVETPAQSKLEETE